jgi:hypothetical protein
MKKIYSLIGAIVLTSSVFAQEEQLKGKVIATPLDQEQTSTSTSLKKTAAVGDTIGWSLTSANYLPEFYPAGSSYVRNALIGGGYIFGNNALGVNMCAQGFLNVNGLTVTISKVLISVYAKKKTSVGASNIIVSIYDMAPNKVRNEAAPGSTVAALNHEGPNTLLSSTPVAFTAIDTTVLPAKIPYRFTVATFSAPVTFSTSFVVAVDSRTTTAGGIAPGDTLGIFSDADDVNNTLDYTYLRYPSGNWVAADFAVAGGLKSNLAIFPILDDEYVGVTEFFNGVKLSALYPNPTKDVATIAYSLEKASTNVSLEVFTINGQKAYSEKFGNQQAGDYKITLDASSYAAGSYFYQLRANGTVLTKEFVVTE